MGIRHTVDAPGMTGVSPAYPAVMASRIQRLRVPKHSVHEIVGPLSADTDHVQPRRPSHSWRWNSQRFLMGRFEGAAAGARVLLGHAVVSVSTRCRFCGM